MCLTFIFDEGYILAQTDQSSSPKSSLKAKRGFCKNCGASFFFKRNSSNYISISAGMFSNPTMLKTKNNIFTKGKLDYYFLDKRIPKYNRYPK